MLNCLRSSAAEPREVAPRATVAASRPRPKTRLVRLNIIPLHRYGPKDEIRLGKSINLVEKRSCELCLQAGIIFCATQRSLRPVLPRPIETLVTRWQPVAVGVQPGRRWRFRLVLERPVLPVPGKQPVADLGEQHGG